MTTTTIKATAEELYADVFGVGDLSACAELEVTFDMQPPERATRDYPGCPATVELTGWGVTNIDIYDEDGKQVYPPSWGEFIPAIQLWVDKNETYLGELACEAEAAKAEEWRY